MMEVHAEKASHFEATRISMAEAVFKKTAEERPDRHGVVIPGCCHTCGGHIRSNHRGHDDAKGPQYEGRTREACYELEVIKAAGPYSLCTDMEEYLRGEHEGKKNMLARLAKGVPKGHLDKNCPLQGFAWQHAYWTLRKFIKGVAERLEVVKMANIVQENRLQEQAALRRRQNREARKSQARSGGAKEAVGPKGSQLAKGGWTPIPIEFEGIEVCPCGVCVL